MWRKLGAYSFLFSDKEIELQKSKVSCPNLSNFPESKWKWQMPLVLCKMTDEHISPSVSLKFVDIYRVMQTQHHSLPTCFPSHQPPALDPLQTGASRPICTSWSSPGKSRSGQAGQSVLRLSPASDGQLRWCWQYWFLLACFIVVWFVCNHIPLTHFRLLETRWAS